AGDITATADRGTPQTFRGITQVMVRGGNNNDAVTYQLNPGDASGFLDGSVRPAYLHVDLGGGNNSIGDTEYLPADGFLRVPWNIDITSGRGNTQVTTEFNNANINANLSVHFGNGVNSFAATLFYPNHDFTVPGGFMGGMNIDVHGGSSRDNFNAWASGI